MRDPSSILIAFVLPLILLFLFGYGVSLDATRTRIGVVLETPEPVDAARWRRLSSRRPISTRASGPIAASSRTDLVRGSIGGIVVIPATFDADLRKRFTAPELQVIVDGSDPNTASLVQGYVQGVVGELGAVARRRVGARRRRRPVRRRASGSIPSSPVASSSSPARIAIVMALVGTLLTALVVAREWERGTMEALMATPVTAVELLRRQGRPLLRRSASRR